MIAAGRDQPSEFFGAGRSQLPVMGAITLPLHGLESSVANRMDRASPRQSDLQRYTTLRARLLLPGKDETRHAGHLGSQQGGGLLPLLFEDLVDG
jgi:hypothetical protein